MESTTSAPQVEYPRVPGQDRPDAVFAANDLIARGVLRALNMQGVLHVPHDIALIGGTAVEILLEEAVDPTLASRQIVFQPELVIRESTSSA